MIGKFHPANLFHPSISSDFLTRSVILGDKLASGGVSDWFPPFYQRVSEWENLHIKETCKKHLKRFLSSLGLANESEDIK
uniref:Uncharacterized protein n=1 Tax=Candidozyma auris TaxID=498019 RepID=A0A0L0NSF9_CANAR